MKDECLANEIYFREISDSTCFVEKMSKMLSMDAQDQAQHSHEVQPKRMKMPRPMHMVPVL